MRVTQAWTGRSSAARASSTPPRRPSPATAAPPAAPPGAAGRAGASAPPIHPAPAPAGPPADRSPPAPAAPAPPPAPARPGAAPAGPGPAVCAEQGRLRPGQILRGLVEIPPCRMADPVAALAIRASRTYCASTAARPKRAVSASAVPASTAFAHNVRGRGCCIRATCIASVDAPEPWPPRRCCHAARSTAKGSTPGCDQNRRSSNASVAAVARSGGATGQYPYPTADRPRRGRSHGPPGSGTPRCGRDHRRGIRRRQMRARRDLCAVGQADGQRQRQRQTRGGGAQQPHFVRAGWRKWNSRASTGRRWHRACSRSVATASTAPGRAPRYRSRTRPFAPSPRPGRSSAPGWRWRRTTAPPATPGTRTAPGCRAACRAAAAHWPPSRTRPAPADTCTALHPRPARTPAHAAPATTRRRSRWHPSPP